ncbi:MAG: cytochrome c maturation protein CcmE [Thermoleophilaceae bacterium]
MRFVDPSRKRKVRLISLLTVAVLLAGALIYTSFSAATEQRTPSQVLGAAAAGETYDLGGKVVADSVRQDGEELLFRVRDPKGDATVAVRYSGAVPDPFREGREVIVTGQMQDGTFVAERDSLVTKCPSKFTNEQQASSS